MSRVAPLRHLGRARLLAVGINSVIGGGIFILPAAVTALCGAAGLYAYLLAGLVIVGVGLSLAWLASLHETSGGPYQYVSRAFGAFAGFQVGWLFCLARLTAMANLMNGFAQYLGALWPRGAGAGTRAALVLLCAAVVVGINVAGIRATSGAASLLAILKVAPLFLLGLAGLFFLHPANFHPSPFRAIDFLRAVLLLIFAFSGFEILTVPAEESLRPRRDIPYALIATIACVCCVYLLVHGVSLGMLDHLESETAPLATAAGMIAGPPGRYGMTAVAALSMAGCTLVSLVGASRLLYAMASAGQIPAFLGALGRRRRAPVVASFLLGGVAAALAIAGGYAELAAVSTGARMLIYLACCFACLAPGAAGARRGRATGMRGKATALLTAVAIVGLLFALERREVIAGTVGVAGGLALYLAARHGRKVTRPAEV